MLDKILNNYFTRKLLEEVKWSFIVRGLDYKFEDDKTHVWVSAKPKKYDDKFYSIIVQIRKDEAFKYMCDLDNFRKQMNKIIEEYRNREEE
jgi:capsule polysaccharide modification protein KpsS